MEFADLGKHCEHPGCHQRDFLPFTCDCCNKVYCLNHRSYRTHECPVAGTRDTHAIECPVCAGSIRVEGTEDPNAAFARHRHDLCNPARRKQRKQKKRCGAKGCHKKLTLTNKFSCDSCRLELCLAHRYPDAHNCASAQTVTRSGFLSRFTQPKATTTRTAANPKPKRPKPARKKNKAGTDKWGRAVDPANTLRGTAARRMRGVDARAVTAAAAPEPAPQAGTGREVCPQCSARFALVTDLVAHVESHHSALPAVTTAAATAAGAGGGVGAGTAAATRVRATPCPRCGASFYDPVDLVAHCESGGCTQTKRQSSCMVS